MCWACSSSSLNVVIIAASSRLPSAILSACALNSSKKLPSRGISRPNMGPPDGKRGRILYHARGAQRLLLGFGEPEPVAVDLRIVRAGRGTRGTHFTRRRRQPRHDAGNGDRSEILVLGAHDRFAGAEMRILQD